jgi:hypothetical protein
VVGLRWTRATPRKRMACSKMDSPVDASCIVKVREPTKTHLTNLGIPRAKWLDRFLVWLTIAIDHQ